MSKNSSNIILLADEERSLTPYDPVEYINNLPAHEYFHDHGCIFEHHYSFR